MYRWRKEGRMGTGGMFVKHGGGVGLLAIPPQVAASDHRIALLFFPLSWPVKAP